VTPASSAATAGGLRSRVSQLGLDDPPALLGTLTIAAWGLWMPWDGGHGPTSWSPIGAFLVLLLGLGLLTLHPQLAQLTPARIVCLGALWSFVVWNYLSLLWADFPGDAWTGSDKTLLYAVCFSIFFLWSWSARAAATMLGLFVLVIAVNGVVWLTRVLAASDPGSFFEDGRALGPIGYVNGSVALWTMALWPAMYLASRRDLPALLRASFLACAALFAQLALLGQSRGWIVVLPLMAALHMLASRQRLRTLLALGLAAGAVTATGPTLLDVYERWDAGEALAHPVRLAATAICVSCVAAGVAGYLWSLVDRSVRLPPAVHRGAAAGAVVVMVAAVSLGAIRVAQSVDDPGEWVSDHWSSFSCVYCPVSDNRSRFTGSLSNDRYREWTVAWHQFTNAPITGAGSDNYLAAYLIERTDDLFEPKYPHSTPLRLLGQLGIVGALLMAVAAGMALVLAVRNHKALGSSAAGAVGAAIVVFAYWLLHGSIDFFWELPALAAPAFGLFALAASVREPVAETAATREPRRLGWRVAPVFVAVPVAVAAIGAPGLGAAYEQAGLQVWRRDAGTAYARLDAAARINPLSARPLLYKGSIATIRGDRSIAERSFREAVDREPTNWYGYLQLALLAGSQRNFHEADAFIAHARTLNPRDRVAAVADRLLRRRIAVAPQLVNNLFLKKERARFLHVGDRRDKS
jgi:hypothetical protein